MIRFTKEHEWIRVDGKVGTVGITDYAQSQLGDVVFVDVASVGKTLKQGDEAAVVESVKAASEVYAPVSGKVLEGNVALGDDPAKVNASAMDEGWFFRIELADPGELDAMMDEAAYQAYVGGL
jgi:glycine cleavage system H protein